MSKLIIAITGRPESGKTTFAEQQARQTGLPIIHTDDIIDTGLSWNELPDYAIKVLPEKCIVEGVLVARMLGQPGFDPDIVHLCTWKGPVQPGHESFTTMVESKCRKWSQETGRIVFVEERPYEE